MKNLLKKLLSKKKKKKDNIIIIDMTELFKDNNEYADLNSHTIHHIVFINKFNKKENG